MEPEVLFRETVYDGKYLEHGCDDEVILLKYPLDRTFDTMRRDLHFERTIDDLALTNQERIEGYLKDRHQVSTDNRNLREYLRHHPNIEFYKLLEECKILRFIRTRKIKIPKPFTVPICDARFLYNNGNVRSILATDNKNFYYLKWAGS